MDRNEKVRLRYNETAERFGIKHIWFCKEIDMAYSTLTIWKAGNTKIGRELMDRIEGMLDRYDKFY